MNYYMWLAWAQIGLAAVVAATNISALVHGRSVVAAVLLLFVAAFIGSMAIWRLQGIHAIKRERREADETETSD